MYVGSAEHRGRKRGIDQARWQISPDDFHFQRTNYSARRSARSFVSAAFANRSASRKCGVSGAQQEIAGASLNERVHRQKADGRN